MRVTVLRVAPVAVALLVAPAPASATTALTASDVRIGSQPAFVRVVVDFTGGTIPFEETELTDRTPADGATRVDVSHRAIQVLAPEERSAHGVRARVRLAGTNRARVVLLAARGRFKYVRLSALHRPERLVIDLYRSAPPSGAAEIRAARDRCLGLSNVRRSGRRLHVSGTERNLFEGAFALQVRDTRGRIVGRRFVTRRGGWNLTVGYRVSHTQSGTVEAVAGSAKDGSLACLAQVRVSLVP